MFVCQRRRQSLQRLLSRLLKSGGLCHASVGLCIGSLFHVIARMDENMGDKRVGGEAVCRLLDTCTALAHAYNRLRPRGMTAGDMVLAADGMDLQTEVARPQRSHGGVRRQEGGLRVGVLQRAAGRD